MKRIWIRVLIPAITLLTAGALQAAPALAAASPAGELGRGCHTYYYHNNPSSGWGFTVCVKAVHDPTAHTWENVGSVTTTTPGMTLHSAVSQVEVFDDSTGLLIRGSLLAKGPAASRILDIHSGTVNCSGHNVVDVSISLSEQVQWPDGELSSFTHTTFFGDVGALDSEFVITTC